MFCKSCLYFAAYLFSGFIRAETPAALVTFVQQAVPHGEIRYRATFTAASSTYHLFTLQQAERKGVLLVRQAGNTQFEIVGADTSFGPSTNEATEIDAVMKAAARLLNGPTSNGFTDDTAASWRDVCPLGASLNELLTPISGFALSSNSTLGILRDLQRSDAYVVEPERAPPGSILVCPSHFTPQGPVIIGFAVIVGADRCVYGPDYCQSGAWHRLGTLSDWLRINQSVAPVSGYLLRAKEKHRPPSNSGNPSQSL